MNIYLGAGPAFLTRNYLNRHANNAGDHYPSAPAPQPGIDFSAWTHCPAGSQPGSDDTIVETSISDVGSRRTVIAQC